MPSEDVKIIVVGDSNVGKSSLLTRLAGEEFDEALGNTIAVEYYHRDWKARRKDVHLQVRLNLNTRISFQNREVVLKPFICYSSGTRRDRNASET